MILRQKTLLGENYLELTPGSKDAPDLADGGRLDDSRVEPTVELDEIYSALDKPTRNAFQEWVRELAKAVRDDGVDPAEALNDAFGNLAGFAVDGSELLRVLDEQEGAVKQLVKNTGATFGALNEQRGALHDLIVNSDRTFDATASRDRELAETIRIFPTFLDESKATVERVARFSTETPARDQRPEGPGRRPGADRALAGRPRAGPEAPLPGPRPADQRVRGRAAGADGRRRRRSAPFLESAHPFFQQLNPILSYFNFHQRTIAGFITNGGADLVGTWGTGRRGQTQIGILTDPKNFTAYFDRPAVRARQRVPAAERAAAGRSRSAASRASTATRPAARSRTPRTPRTSRRRSSRPQQAPPCLIAPPSLYDGKQVQLHRRGRGPHGRQGAPGPRGQLARRRPEPERPGGLAGPASAHVEVVVVVHERHHDAAAGRAGRGSGPTNTFCAPGRHEHVDELLRQAQVHLARPRWAPSPGGRGAGSRCRCRARSGARRGRSRRTAARSRRRAGG